MVCCLLAITASSGRKNRQPDYLQKNWDTAERAYFNFELEETRELILASRSKGVTKGANRLDKLTESIRA